MKNAYTSNAEKPNIVAKVSRSKGTGGKNGAPAGHRLVMPGEVAYCRYKHPVLGCLGCKNPKETCTFNE